MIIFDQNSENRDDENIFRSIDAVSQSELCMLKAFSRFLDVSVRCKIELIIKIIELRQTFHLINEIENGNYTEETPKLTMENVLTMLKEELPADQIENFKQMEEMMETMQLYQEMMLMKEDE